MGEASPTRNELRAILANPESTQEQVLQAKLILMKRIVNGIHSVRQICERYCLSPEASEKLMTQHRNTAGEMETNAEQEVRRLEHLLAETRESK